MRIYLRITFTHYFYFWRRSYRTKKRSTAVVSRWAGRTEAGREYGRIRPSVGPNEKYLKILSDSLVPNSKLDSFESNSIVCWIVRRGRRRRRFWQALRLMCQAHFDYTYILLFHFIRVSRAFGTYSEKRAPICTTLSPTTMNFCVADTVPSVGLFCLGVCEVNLTLCPVLGRETNFPISYMNSFYYGWMHSSHTIRSEALSSARMFVERTGEHPNLNV